MASELTRVIDTLEAYKLSSRHAEYCKDSFKSLRPRYHNEIHCYSTALTFDQLALESDLNEETRRNGFVAALYHDAHHLMARDDSDNIKSAIQWVRQADFFEASIDVKHVERLIRATSNTNQKLHTKAELLMHDADILQTVKGSFFENVIWQKKLAEELAMSITFESSLRFVVESVRCPETVDFLKRVILGKRTPKS